MKDYDDDPPYPENPPWTMFFEGPLYARYREFMANKDFSKILLTSKLQMANQSSSIADLPDVHGGMDWWSVDHNTIDRSEKQMANDTYNSVSDDFYKKFTRGKREEKRRTRRTRAIILIIILVLLGVSLGTALIIHYFFIPPDQDLTPAQVNISFSGNTSIFDMTTESITLDDSGEIDVPIKEVIGTDKKDVRGPVPNNKYMEEDILNPDGRLFEEAAMVTAVSTSESTLFKKIGKVTFDTSTLVNTTSSEQLTTETETFNPLDFFAIDEAGVTSTAAVDKGAKGDSPISAFNVTTNNDSLTTLDATFEGTTTDMLNETFTKGQIEATDVTTYMASEENTTAIAAEQPVTLSSSKSTDNMSANATAETSTIETTVSNSSVNNADNAFTTTTDFVPESTSNASVTELLESTTSNDYINSSVSTAANTQTTIWIQDTITNGSDPASNILPQPTVTIQTGPTEAETTMRTGPTEAATTTQTAPLVTSPQAGLTKTTTDGAHLPFTSTESLNVTQNTTDYGHDVYTTDGTTTEFFTTTSVPETTTEVLPQMWMNGSTAYKSEAARIVCKVLDPGRSFIITIKETQSWFPIEVNYDSNRTIKWVNPGSNRHNLEVGERNTSTGSLKEVTLVLTVSNVECQDSGTYQCTVTKDRPIMTKTASVIVVGRPDNKIELQIGPSVVENRALRLTAVWQGGYPVPWTNMSWTALDAENNTYNLAEYGEYRDYELNVDRDQCSTFLKSSIVIFPKVHLNDTTVIVKPDLVTTKSFVNDSMTEYLKRVQYGVQKILVIPLDYCHLSKDVKDMSVNHPYTACTKYVRCLPGDLVVQQCPTGTCFHEQRQECM